MGAGVGLDGQAGAARAEVRRAQLRLEIARRACLVLGVGVGVGVGLGVGVGSGLGLGLRSRVAPLVSCSRVGATATSAFPGWG